MRSLAGRSALATSPPSRPLGKKAGVLPEALPHRHNAKIALSGCDAGRFCRRRAAGGSGVRGTGRRWVAGLVAVVALGSALLVGARIAQAHSGDVIQAAWAVTIPTIDGA